MITAKERDHMAKIIKKEVSYFNGWTVSDGAVEEACFKAAVKIENYLRRKNKISSQ